MILIITEAQIVILNKVVCYLGKIKQKLTQLVEHNNQVTRLSLEGARLAGSFVVLSRFFFYNLYVYCTAHSTW